VVSTRLVNAKSKKIKAQPKEAGTKTKAKNGEWLTTEGTEQDRIISLCVLCALCGLALLLLLILVN
jgi:hypothetical protein